MTTRSSRHTHRSPRQRWDKAQVRHYVLAGLSLTGLGVASVHYVVLPSFRVGHPYLPSPVVWLVTLVIAIVAPPELYLLSKAANAKDQQTYQQYTDLMIRWPYSLVAWIIALATKAWPRSFLGNEERGQETPITTAEVMYTEEEVGEMLAMPLKRIYALLVDRDILSMTNDELRKVAGEVQREARMFGGPRSFGPSAPAGHSPSGHPDVYAQGGPSGLPMKSRETSGG
jgi:hypothetical protein